MCRTRKILFVASFSLVMISTILAAAEIKDVAIAFKETTPIVKVALNFTLIGATSPPVSITIGIDDKDGNHITRMTLYRRRFQVNGSRYHLPYFQGQPNVGGITPGLIHTFHFAAVWHGNVESNTAAITRKIPPHPVANVTVERKGYTYIIQFNTFSAGFYDRLDIEQLFEMRDREPDITIASITNLGTIPNNRIEVTGSERRALRRVKLTTYSSQTPCLNPVAIIVKPRYEASITAEITKFEPSFFKSTQGYKLKANVEITVSFNQGYGSNAYFGVQIKYGEVGREDILINIRENFDFYKSYTLKEENSEIKFEQNNGVLIPGHEYTFIATVYDPYYSEITRYRTDPKRLVVPPKNVKKIQYFHTNMTIRVEIDRTGAVDKLHLTLKLIRGDGTFKAIPQPPRPISDGIDVYGVQLQDVENGTHQVFVRTSSKGVQSEPREPFTFVNLEKVVVRAKVSVKNSSYDPGTNEIAIEFQVTDSNMAEGDKFEIKICNVNSLTNCQTKLLDIQSKRLIVSPISVGTHNIEFRTYVPTGSPLRIRSEEIAGSAIVPVVPLEPRNIQVLALRPPHENRATLTWNRPLSLYHGIEVECVTECNWFDSVLIPKTDGNRSYELQRLTSGAVVLIKVRSLFNESNNRRLKSEAVELEIHTWPSPFLRLSATSQKNRENPTKREFTAAILSRSPPLVRYYRIEITIHRLIVNQSGETKRLIKTQRFNDLEAIRNANGRGTIDLIVKTNEKILGTEYILTATGYGPMDNLVTPSLNTTISVAPAAPIGLSLRSQPESPSINLEWTYSEDSIQDSALVLICYAHSPETCIDEIELLGVPTEPAPQTYDSPKLPEVGKYLIFVKARFKNVESSLSAPVDFTVGTPCTHPDGIRGKLYDDSDKNLYYFPSEKDYTLSCDEGFKLRQTKVDASLDGIADDSATKKGAPNHLWSCKGGEWVPRSECQAAVNIAPIIAVSSGTAGIILFLICLAVSYRKHKSNKRCKKEKKRKGDFGQSMTMPRGYS